MNTKTQQGFTLIELIMVIVILGILAATALPKFADLGGDARTASINAAAGAVKSAMSIVHSKSLIDGTANKRFAKVDLEGTTIQLNYGYPTRGDIHKAAGLDAAYTNSSGTGKIVLVSDNACTFTYKAATATKAASIGTVRGC